MFHFYGLYHIYLYLRSAIYVFSVIKGGGGSELRFSVLLHHGLFCVFSDDVDIFGWNSRWSSSFCVFECYGSLLGFMSDGCSFVVAFVDYLFILDIYLYISMYIQDEYRRFCVFLFVSYLLYLFYPISCCVMYYYGYGWPRSFCLFLPDGVHIIYHYGFS